MYSTTAGTRLELLVDLYDESTLDATITETDTLQVVVWIDGAVGRSFTEVELAGDEILIRLASCKYNAFSIMSALLEGHNVEEESLARIRLQEAKELVSMWCNAHGITPMFVDGDGAATNTDYAYAVGTDANCI